MGVRTALICKRNQMILNDSNSTLMITVLLPAGYLDYSGVI